ncbi:AAA domain-containing protein [Streptomyces sp. PAN_FS17]|uniref:AAA domain-containing protein n=1 Tax=Streptomyces sp. PAN_FS17 TaxID=1855351 RepID=UPI000894E478|nr:AAA domain-containing protein [Streptomyces sp. PAN_FS17]SED03780.1 Protein kinase domain-containing protein [Streptomyces sp. PAN_FS17]
MTLAVGVSLLNGRYEITERVSPETDEGQLWAAQDTMEFVPPYLLKTWHFYDRAPDDVQRALWDAELRTLYQVRSTPGSEGSLLQLHDVGIDSEQRCFVMVFKTGGLQTLASLLARRDEHDWLSGRSSGRRELWQMLGRIAEGLALLHDQQVVHRSVSPESVFLDPGKGPESCLLGGFEWSVRLGRPTMTAPSRAGWETAPEALGDGSAFGPDADWFAFGMLVARCMLSIEHLSGTVDPMKRYRLVLDHLAKAKRKLTPQEYDFIALLIADEPMIRPKHGVEVSAVIRDIVHVLQQPSAGADGAPRHLVVIDPGNRWLQRTCLDLGLREVLQLGPADPFDPRRPEHMSGLLGFLYKDFSDGATLAPVSNRDEYILSGQSLHLLIGPARTMTGASTSWQNAFCVGTKDFFTADSTRQVDIPAGRIGFFNTRNYRQQAHVLSSASSWETLLPKIDTARERREDQERFAEFVRITNQIDILIRDAELFRCRVTDVQLAANKTVDSVKLEEVPRLNEPMSMLQLDGGMAEFLLREKHSGKPGSNLIHLCPPESETIGWQVPFTEPEWRVDDVDVPGRSATLRPETEILEPPQVGDIRVLRTKGLKGQVDLIRRRKEAIGRLSKHTYLLESLSEPGQVIMDSGPVQLPLPLPDKIVDPSKRGQIEKILGVRPIYALQGPPGTGKTHMVAWLLREILQEDPVAQILITAQAHPAVDVLRSKVEKEAFKDVPEDRRPLAIRLRRTNTDQAGDLPKDEPGSERHVTAELLGGTIRRLEDTAERHELSGIQADWLDACRTMLVELRTRDASLAKEFRELVKRSASITYSTAADGDLAALAGEVSYDWAIVEEAGKAHGFELALPLSLGHRWLLIGDPKQLPPYRIEDYQSAVSTMDETVAALERMEGLGKLLDRELLNAWRARTDEQRTQFGEYCKEWLKLFLQLHRLCSYHEHDEGLLTGQHRMHPDIGELVSQTYYDGRLEHYTRDKSTEQPHPEILHGLTAPAEIHGKAVVWLDLPAATDKPVALEDAMPKYRNMAEAHALERFLRSLRGDPNRKLELAVLSPYAQQVGHLRTRLDTPEMRRELDAAGFVLAADPRRSASDPAERRQDGFFTVDSFQGNQSKIIAVSLVRNNTKLPGDGLGFLKEPSRMNVLISRAELLLVLVGSWDFFRNQVAHVSRKQEQGDPLRHWALAVDQLEQWFDTGRAVRIQADLDGFHTT